MARLTQALLAVAALGAAALDGAAQDRQDAWRPRTTPLLGVGYAPDVGLLLGAGVVHTRYGFRALPPSTRLRAEAAYATAARTYHAEIEGEFRRPLAPSVLNVEWHASGLEMLRFYGFGNESQASQPDTVYRVRQRQVLLAPSVTVPLAPRFRLTLGPLVKYAHTRPDTATVLGRTGPYYGAGNFGQIGTRAVIERDTRDVPPAATVALRAGGAHVSGTVPFHEVVYIGGETTVRGYPEQRFAGTSGAYANAELRLLVAQPSIGDLGIFGLADAGRVWIAGESSDRWHAAAGGGVWFAWQHRRSNTVTIAVARSPERTAVYVRAGFMF